MRAAHLPRLYTDSLLNLRSLAFCHRADEEELPQAKAGKTAQQVFLAAHSARFQGLRPPWQAFSPETAMWSFRVKTGRQPGGARLVIVTVLVLDNR